MDDYVFALGVATTYPSEVEAVDPGVPLEEIRRLVASAEREEAATKALELLGARPQLSRWVYQVLSDPWRRPPHLQPLQEGHRGVEMDGQGVPGAEEYRCSVHDYAWFRMSVRDRIPTCPFGGETLVRS